MRTATTYPKGVRPWGDGLQLDFKYKGKRYRPTWPCSDPKLKANIKAAEDKLRIIKLQIKQEKMGIGKFNIAEHFAEYAESRGVQKMQDLLSDAMYERLNKASHLSSSTRLAYRLAIKEFDERWPGMKTANLTVDCLREWIMEEKEAGTAIKTILNKLCVLRPPLRRAHKRGLIKVNPIDQLDENEDFARSQKEITRRAIKSGEEKKVDPYDPDEIKAIIATMTRDKDRWRWIQAANLAKVFLEGPRTGEGFAITWDDVDWIKNRLHICRTFTNGILGARKNAKEVVDYYVDLSPQGLDALRQQKAYTFAMEPYDTGTDFGKLRFVFRCLKSGAPLWTRDSHYRNQWECILRRAGVRYRSPYQLRHTCATYAISAGEEIEWIAKHKLGNSVEMVRKHYAEWTKEIANRNGYVAGSKLEQLWSKLA